MVYDLSLISKDLDEQEIFKSCLKRRQEYRKELKDKIYSGKLIKDSDEVCDSSFYENNIEDENNSIYTTPSIDHELAEVSQTLHENDISESVILQELKEGKVNENVHKIYYVSDVHINYKLKNAFPNGATEQEIVGFIRQYLYKLVLDAKDRMYTVKKYLLIGGDTSFNFEVSKIFYTELAKIWEKDHIIVILGNHELWNYRKNKNKIKLDDTILMYRKLFKKLGIIFLHNDLLIFRDDLDFNGAFIIREDHLLEIPENKLKEFCLKSPLKILGGIGFSGYNNEFNAQNGIYKNIITSLDEDLKQTKKFEKIYQKVKKTLQNDQVIIFTHNPKEDWTKDEYVSNWIYVNGHTHKNLFFNTDGKVVYSDNQIGYYKKSIGLKSFKVSAQYDIFKELGDGIYTITNEEYIDFNRGLGKCVNFNNENGIINMLKKAGYYCFILKSNSSENLFLLNGGRKKKLKVNDLNYYYDNMQYYAESMKNLLKTYFGVLKQISNSIKKIGGSGNIHGCIVDIDFYNHIYLNPLDGKITPYYAKSVVDKYIYSDIESLLKSKCNYLYVNYQNLINKNEGEMVLKEQTNKEYINKIQYCSDTKIYGPSRIMKSLQYIYDINVICNWNDKIIDRQKRLTGK